MRPDIDPRYHHHRRRRYLVSTGLTVIVQTRSLCFEKLRVYAYFRKEKCHGYPLGKLGAGSARDSRARRPRHELYGKTKKRLPLCFRRRFVLGHLGIRVQDMPIARASERSRFASSLRRLSGIEYRVVCSFNAVG